MAETRKLKVYHATGRNYDSVPSIVFKAKWLEKYGFMQGTPIQVECAEGKLIITPRQPDPDPDFVGDIISSLSPKQRRILEKSLQEMP